MKNLLKLKECGGFMAVDMIILMAVLAAAAVIWSSAGMVFSAQQQNFCRTTAVFLAQGELNKMEYAVENDTDTVLAEETVNCNNTDFFVQKEIFSSNEIFLLKVKVSWYYENGLQEEIQERTVYKR